MVSLEIFDILRIILCSCNFRRKHPFKLFVALDTTGSAEGELYWDDGEDIGNLHLM